jgi:hypothetical protein
VSKSPKTLATVHFVRF